MVSWGAAFRTTVKIFGYWILFGILGAVLYFVGGAAIVSQFRQPSPGVNYIQLIAGGLVILVATILLMMASLAVPIKFVTELIVDEVKNFGGLGSSRVCTNCGVVNPRKARFCSNCRATFEGVTVGVKKESPVNAAPKGVIASSPSGVVSEKPSEPPEVVPVAQESTALKLEEAVKPTGYVVSTIKPQVVHVEPKPVEKSPPFKLPVEKKFHNLFEGISYLILGVVVIVFGAALSIYINLPLSLPFTLAIAFIGFLIFFYSVVFIVRNYK